MKLYTSKNNPTGRKVEAVLNHIGLEAEIEYLSFENGEVHSERFRTINPNCKIPALVDGSVTLWESNAIMIYLCTIKKVDHPLFALNLRPQILQWLFWESAHFTAALRGLAYEVIIKSAFNLGDPCDITIENDIKDFSRYAGILNAHLDDRDFMVGEDWTLADYAIGFFEGTINRLPIDIAQYSNLASFYKRMAENPYWIASKIET